MVTSFKRPLSKYDQKTTERPGFDKNSSESTPFFCYLPDQTGWFTRIVLSVLFSRIKIDPRLITTANELQKSGIVVFVNKYKSLFDLLFYHTRYRKENIPYPNLGFDYNTFLWQPVRRFFRGLAFYIRHLVKYRRLPDPYKQQYYRNKLLNGKSALLSLIEEKGFYRRLVESKTDPIDYLIEMQKTIADPIYLLPQLIVYGQSPQAARLSFLDLIFGSKERPGRARRLFMLLKSPKKILIEASEPVCLIDFLERPDIRELSQKNQVTALRRYLTDQINRHRQSITGPDLKSRVEIMEEVLTRPEMQKTIGDYSLENHLSIHTAQKEAADYLNEIAANYNQKVIRLFEIALRWTFRSIFDGMVIDHEGLNRAKQASKKGPLILVPCHKSHLDYLILSYILFTNSMPPPHIAAGKNLSFWPIGPIFRGGGAFFLRRTFKGEPLYPKVFFAYVQKMLEEGFHLEFFIEGGRSRTGKLLAPKIGFLLLLWDAFWKSDWEDMIFVPVYIGYDRVLEEKAYIHELEGGKKAPESIANIFQARKSLRKKYGKIYVNFHEPLSLKDYFEQSGTDFSDRTRDEQKENCYRFGEKIVSAISRESIITPHAIVAAAFLNSTKKRIYYKELMDNVESYMNYLSTKQVKLADTLYLDRQNTFDYVIDLFASNKFIDRSTTVQTDIAPVNPILKVHENKRPNLDYYKNNGVLLFIPGAYTALSILSTDAFQFSTIDLYDHYKKLRELFEFEFVFDPDDVIEVSVRKNIKAFIDDAIIIPHPTLPDTYNLTSAGYRKLNLFAAFLTPYLESYWVVLNFYMRYTHRPILEIKDYTKKIQNLGTRMYKRNEISRKEALSKINYKNAVSYFTSHGLVNPEIDAEELDAYVRIIQFYRGFLSS